MKTWFDDSDLLYWNSMLVLGTMFKDRIINKKDIEKKLINISPRNIESTKDLSLGSIFLKVL